MKCDRKKHTDCTKAVLNMNGQRLTANAVVLAQRLPSLDENESRNTHNTPRLTYGVGHHAVGLYDLHPCSGCRTPGQKLCSQCRCPACSTAGFGARQRWTSGQRTPEGGFRSI